MKSSLIIIGYSGHAYVCIDAANSQGTTIIGYCDKSPVNTNPYGLDFLGPELELEFGSKVFISIGDNIIRERLFKQLNSKLVIENVFHNSAIISHKVNLGKGILVGPGCIVNALSKIDDGVIVNSGTIIEHECEIGEFSHIAPGTVLTGNVKIGKRCFIGANSVVKPNITIVDDVVLGMGSVVTKNIIESGIYFGNPAKKRKEI